MASDILIMSYRMVQWVHNIKVDEIQYIGTNKLA